MDVKPKYNRMYTPKASKDAKIWIDYHSAHSKKNTVRSYQSVIDRFCQDFGDVELRELSYDEMLSLLNRVSDGNKPYTKRVRYARLSSFFNFIRNNIDPNCANPCDTPMIRKLYRERVALKWELIEKETVDEIIFRTANVLIFPICHEAFRVMISKAGKMVGIRLRPQDQRRHSATTASRFGTPIEIVSKVIRRHANLSTAQRYLGKISDVEAMRWIENLYG
jgi:integrase